MLNPHFFARFTRHALAIMLLGLSCVASMAQAADLPVAAGSPIAGIAFDDRPLMLPVQRNFQMAMLTAGSELGRTCGTMEAYGWRLDQSEQGRVNQIFNNTVDRMRAQGFVVETKSPHPYRVTSPCSRRTVRTSICCSCGRLVKSAL